jgi:hypothetical protein
LIVEEQEVEELEQEDQIEEEDEVIEEELEVESEESEDENEPSEEEEEHLEITLDGETLAPEEEEDDTPVIRNIRQANREIKKQKRELERRLAELEQSQQGAGKAKVEELREPDFEEDCDSDPDVYATKFKAFHRAKSDQDKKKAQMEAQQKEQQEAWNERMKVFEESKKKLSKSGYRDYDDVEEVITEKFDQNQQALVVDVADDPALLLYAIGKKKGEVERLSKIKNLGRLAKEIGHIESRLKVNKTKAKPAPERKVGKATSSASSVDSTRKKLEAEALQKGDMSKLMAWERKQRAKKRKT